MFRHSPLLGSGSLSRSQIVSLTGDMTQAADDCAVGVHRKNIETWTCDGDGDLADIPCPDMADVGLEVLKMFYVLGAVRRVKPQKV